ncbi:MAG: cytochrome C oxidase subunit III, cytochrome c oxidase subunit III [Armatimonadetes bacterium CSP1-3]|nr:MAG: cytochrome C oxidase subunit III, cytochrome c oxidase subunit III [Armatimonadetes bacterium CSP1-3]
MSEALQVREQHRTTASAWGGGESPFAVPWAKLMMWLFLLSDAFTFAALLTGYAAMRITAGVWPGAGMKAADFFHVTTVVGPMTFILICSSATMAVAVGAARRGDHRTTVRFLALTVLGGLAFLGMQAYEWTGFIREGARLTGFVGELGGKIQPMFPATFFVITGFHGGHVTSGVIYLLVKTIQASRGRASAESVEITGLYWHFVDLVWVFIFTLLYLI